MNTAEALTSDDLIAFALQRAIAEWVKPCVMANITGLTEKAMDRKRETGRWPKGLVWDKVANEVLYSIAGYNKWVNQNRSCRLVCEPEAITSKSTSIGTESANTSNGRTRPRRQTSLPLPVYVLK